MSPVVMRQQWRDLLFLHWDFSPEHVQRSLPAGLEVDTFDGRAWIGLVPFFMCRVRPRGLPAVPILSDFLELNVRTYVRDHHGRPGVWFYSLDCNQPLAVRLARIGFSLPYFDAAMSASRLGSTIAYTSRRHGTSATCSVTYRPSGTAAPATPGSLEEFLVERYRLFAFNGRRLLTGCVSHAPYHIGPVDWNGNPSPPLALAGFSPNKHAPCHAVLSSGVDVKIHAPAIVDNPA